MHLHCRVTLCCCDDGAGALHDEFNIRALACFSSPLLLLLSHSRRHCTNIEFIHKCQEGFNGLSSSYCDDFSLNLIGLVWE